MDLLLNMKLSPRFTNKDGDFLQEKWGNFDHSPDSDLFGHAFDSGEAPGGVIDWDILIYIAHIDAYWVIGNYHCVSLLGILPLYASLLGYHMDYHI